MAEQKRVRSPRRKAGKRPEILDLSHLTGLGVRTRRARYLRDARTFLVPALLTARLLAEKGIFEFVTAARRIKREAPGVRFILLGGLDSNPHGISRADVEAWLGEGLLEWPGHAPVRPWLAQASVFVLPSYYREGVPRSIQ